MKLAIMQPYAFPYLGYFQLIHAVDEFVLLDNVAFIKQGWINRNCLLKRQSFACNSMATATAQRFTIPVHRASSRRQILDIRICDSRRWRRKLLVAIEQVYRRAPCFDRAWPLVRGLVGAQEPNLAAYNELAIRRVAEYLGIETRIVRASKEYATRSLRGESRVRDICRQARATEYLNSEGGRHLYDFARFAKQGIELSFLTYNASPYNQFGGPFVSHLSIIDVMMFNSPGEINSLLRDYRLHRDPINAIVA